MNTINALKLADFILATYPNKGITPMKLQKLAYYTKVWTLVAGKDFVRADFHKWDFGPVNQDIYHAYKIYGGKTIPAVLRKHEETAKHQEDILLFILDNYIEFSAFQLSAMTHNEEPWLKTPHDAVISDTLIFEYYSKQSFAKNFKNTKLQEGPFHLLQNDSWHSFTLDMSSEEAVALESYISYDDFLTQSAKAEQESQEFFKELFL